MPFPPAVYADRHPVRVLGAEEFARRIAAGRTAEGLARNAAATKARWNVPEYRLRQALPRHRTPEHQAALDAASAAARQDPDVRARSIAGHARTMVERRRRQAAILAAAECELGLTPACRDLALLRLLVADWGVYQKALAGYLDLPESTLSRWLAGASPPGAG